MFFIGYGVSGELTTGVAEMAARPAASQQEQRHGRAFVAEPPTAPPDAQRSRNWHSTLFHDVGKPKTRSIGDGGVSFHHHEVVGARMTRDRMRALHYSNDDIEAVSRLVELHLRFHGYDADVLDRQRRAPLRARRRARCSTGSTS